MRKSRPRSDISISAATRRMPQSTKCPDRNLRKTVRYAVRYAIHFFKFRSTFYIPLLVQLLFSRRNEETRKPLYINGLRVSLAEKPGFEPGLGSTPTTPLAGVKVVQKYVVLSMLCGIAALNCSLFVHYGISLFLPIRRLFQHGNHSTESTTRQVKTRGTEAG